MESFRSLRKARFTDILDYGIQLYKKHFREIFLLNLMFNIPMMVLLALINPVFTDQYWNMFNTTTDIEPNAIFSSVLTLYTMVFGVIALYGINTLTLQNVWEGSVIKILYADVVLNQKRSIKQVVRECFKQFWTLMLGRLLYNLIIYAVVFVLYFIIVIGVFVGVFAVIGSAASSLAAPWVMVVLTIVGTLLALAFVIGIAVLVSFFLGRYWLFLPSICIEQKKGAESISRCNSLGKNNFWLLSLTYAVGYLFIMMFPGIVNISFNAISLLAGDTDLVLLKTGMVVTQIFTAVLQPLLTCILTALYIALRVKREGLDMEVTLWSIKQEEMDRTHRWMAEAPNVSE
jgi:hypothetical protein